MDPLRYVKEGYYESTSELTLTVSFYEAAGCGDKYNAKPRKPMNIGYFRVVREFPPFENTDTESWFRHCIGASFLAEIKTDRDGEICSVRPVCMVGKTKVVYGKYMPLECIELI